MHIKSKLRLLVYSATCIFLLQAFDCHKEGENCHHTFTVNNNTAKTLIFGVKFQMSGSCNIQGPRIGPGESYKMQLYTECWEQRLSGTSEDFYLIDSLAYNNPSVYYSCDSAEIYNTVLKKYTLHIQDLQASNFELNYP